MRRALLIVNPAARGGRSAEAEALMAFASVGIEPDLRRTTAPGDAARIAAAEAGEEPVFVLGGDGTVMEVVGALVGRGTAVGILPGGTGNQLARHFGIPLQVGRAVRRLVGAGTTPLDLGRLHDGRYFSLTAGFGLDAAMIAGADPRAKRRFGVAAYVWSAAKALPSVQSFAVRVEADGQVYEREAALAMIANVGAVMDGRFGLGPGVAPDDGWLDVCVLSAAGLRDGLTLAWRMARRDFRADPRMLFVRARQVRLTAPAGVPVQADGELLTAPILDAAVVPGAGHFLAPGGSFAPSANGSYVPSVPTPTLDR
ncbi:MAG: diacylglycerol kinase family lipid kinase [Gemmatimonadaceae bacterium]|nr:diacylglycerol kinase family lipid kinase [Gemmatimonadaceae bacterium]MCW5825822.1 diacylglycerol kinase family lipid kinase [Gemmatimonadaceae bacterium]